MEVLIITIATKLFMWILIVSFLVIIFNQSDFLLCLVTIELMYLALILILGCCGVLLEDSSFEALIFIIILITGGESAALLAVLYEYNNLKETTSE